MIIKAIVLIAVVVASGCGVKHIRGLRNAEVVFNRAILDSAGALADYRVASRLLDDLSDKQNAT